MLKADLPYGFQQESGFNKFTTWVYCLDKDKLQNSGAAALPASCTSGCRRPAEMRIIRIWVPAATVARELQRSFIW